MNPQKDLLPIGSFASLTMLSFKALRLYDQLDLLQPRYIDPQSGYRYYGTDQLPIGRLIRSMREMDMPLATIRQVLAALPVSSAQAEALVRGYVDMCETRVEQIQQQAQCFIHLLRQEAIAMGLEVNVKKIPTQQVISITRHLKVDKLSKTIQKDVHTLDKLVKEQGLEATEAPFGIYHGPITHQDDGPIEVCMPVNGKAQPQGEVTVKQLEGGNAVCVLLLGKQCHFPELLGAYDAAADWIQKNGYETAQPPREVWYSTPDENPKWEIVWLFK